MEAGKSKSCDFRLSQALAYLFLGTATILWDKFGTSTLAGLKPCWIQQLKKGW